MVNKQHNRQDLSAEKGAGVLQFIDYSFEKTCKASGLAFKVQGNKAKTSKINTSYYYTKLPYMATQGLHVPRESESKLPLVVSMNGVRVCAFVPCD